MPYWQRFPSPNFDVPALPQFEGATNIQPFTYRDGATFLEMIDDLRKWCDDALTEPVNAKLQEYLTHLRSFAEGWAEQLAAHRSEIVSLTEEMRETINDAFKIFDGINTKSGSLPIQEISGGDIVIQPQNTWPRGWPLVLKVISTTGKISFASQYFRADAVPYTEPNTDYFFFLLPYGENKWRAIPIVETINKVRIGMFGYGPDAFYKAINYAHLTNSELYIDANVSVGDETLNITKPVTIDGGGKQLVFGASGRVIISAASTIKNVELMAADHRSVEGALITLNRAHDAKFDNISLKAKFTGGRLVQFPSLFEITGSDRVVINNIRGYAGGYFIFSTTLSDLTVQNCIISSGGGGIIINGSARGAVIKNCRFTYTANESYRGERHALRISGDSYALQITGNEFQLYPGGGVVLDGAAHYYNVDISRNRFYGNQVAAIHIVGRPGYNLRDITIDRNNIIGAVRDGIDIDGIVVSNIGQLSISGNMFPADGRNTVDTAIKINSCSRARIRGCDISIPRGIGIDISGRSPSCRISDCSIMATHPETISAIRLAPLTILGTVVQGCTISAKNSVLSFSGGSDNDAQDASTMHFGALIYSGAVIKSATESELAKVHFDIVYLAHESDPNRKPAKAFPGSTFRDETGIYLYTENSWRKVNS